ncbi:MAG: type IVB secretion system protein IcmG/DotF [Gammaproteobacteria bacterium]|nr:type IVB secretion system protein IcmG/DotF [Gammaproteobacteria bacterium]
MADKKNDEYQLDDADLLGGTPEALEDPGAVSQDEPPVAAPAGGGAQGVSQLMSGLAPVQRNAIIVVGVVVWLVVIYKLIAHFHHEPKVDLITRPPAPVVQVEPAMPAIPPIQSSQPMMAGESDQHTRMMDEKISSLSSASDGLRGDVSNLNNQMSSVQASVQSTADKLTELTNTIARLSEKLDAQTQAMQILELKVIKGATKPKPRKMRGMGTRTSYFVQALIPGRAWLISADGSDTVSVREGSQLAGYGTVQMIDPNQGRVLTSSGKTIRFSRQDN